jgi:hypothetical protein
VTAARARRVPLASFYPERVLVRSLALLFLSACGDDDGPAPGVRDAGFDAAARMPDAGRDASPSDAGMFDADMGDATCASAELGTRLVTPNVIVIIDRSGSMNLAFPGSTSRWVALRDALVGMPNGITFALGDLVRFGTLMYSDDPEFPGCPETSSVTAAIGSFTNIAAQFTSNIPGGNTPTGEAVTETIERVATLAPERAEPTYFILATDGEPALCADGANVVMGRALVVEQVGIAFDMGIQTFVLSVGDEIANEHLQDVANAGVGRGAADPDAPYWVATDSAGLSDALEAITSSAISCVIELDGRIDTSLACSGTVTLGADELECDEEWEAVDESHIQLLGPACERLQSSPEEVLRAVFPCDALI